MGNRSKKIKIAYFGLCFDVYTKSFVTNLKQQIPGLEIHYFNYTGQQETFDRNPVYFDAVVELPTPLLSKGMPNVPKAIISSIIIICYFFNIDLIYLTFCLLRGTVTLKQYKEYVGSFVNDVYRYRFLKNKLKDYDIVHLNGVYHTYCSFLSKLPQGKKLICSFWGSDLWWNSGLINYMQLQRILNRADTITVFTEEMKDLFITKFGRNYAEKTRVMLFGMNEEIRDFIMSHDKGQAKISFCDRYNIKATDLLVCISNNAARHRIQHDYLIELIMENVPKHITDQIVFVIPFGYGSLNKEEDLNIITATLLKYKCQYVFITKYLELYEVAEMRNAVDIYIQTPLTDSFSMALLESILAKNICITGSWLPYRTIKINNVRLFEVNAIDEVPATMTRIIEDINNVINEIRFNAVNVAPIAFWDFTILEWARLVNDLVTTDN